MPINLLFTLLKSEVVEVAASASSSSPSASYLWIKLRVEVFAVMPDQARLEWILLRLSLINTTDLSAVGRRPADRSAVHVFVHPLFYGGRKKPSAARPLT